MPFDGTNFTTTIHADLQVLRRVRKNLPGRWCKGALTNSYKHHCLIGWLNYVTRQSSTSRRIATEHLYPRVIGNFGLGDEVCRVAAFNDRPFTTEADVLGLLDRAIAAAETKALMADGGRLP